MSESQYTGRRFAPLLGLKKNRHPEGVAVYLPTGCRLNITEHAAAVNRACSD